jgi:hypothetical protein
MHGDVVLPAFELDCRDWLVATPYDAGLPEELDGTPLLAILSTAVFDPTSFSSASAVLTIALLGQEAAAPLRRASGRNAPAMVEIPQEEAFARYVAPTPDGQLAVVVDFTLSGQADPELMRRIEDLVASFHWTN